MRYSRSRIAVDLWICGSVDLWICGSALPLTKETTPTSPATSRSGRSSPSPSTATTVRVGRTQECQRGRLVPGTWLVWEIGTQVRCIFPLTYSLSPDSHQWSTFLLATWKLLPTDTHSQHSRCASVPRVPNRGHPGECRSNNINQHGS